MGAIRETEAVATCQKYNSNNSTITNNEGGGQVAVLKLRHLTYWRELII